MPIGAASRCQISLGSHFTQSDWMGKPMADHRRYGQRVLREARPKVTKAIAPPSRPGHRAAIPAASPAPPAPRRPPAGSLPAPRQLPGGIRHKLTGHARQRCRPRAARQIGAHGTDILRNPKIVQLLIYYIHVCKAIWQCIQYRSLDLNPACADVGLRAPRDAVHRGPVPDFRPTSRLAVPARAAR